MFAVTVQQPWAWAVVHGGKNVENRTRIGTWRRAVGQTVAIHAGQRWSERGAECWDLRRAVCSVELGYQADGSQVWAADSVEPDDPWFVFGAIIGTVDVADVHLSEGGCCAPWGEQTYIEAGGARRVDIAHLVLANPRPVEPIDCRGALGLWTVPGDVSELLALS